MTEQLTSTQHTSAYVQSISLTSPLCYLSSTNAGWESLQAQAFYEPMEIEGWMTMAIPDISLILFAGGTMYMEQRQAHGPWKAQELHHGELIVRLNMHQPYELRWKVRNCKPMQTLHLHLSKSLLASAVEEIADFDLTHLSQAAGAGLQDPLLAQIGFLLWEELQRPSPAGKLYAQAAAQMLAMHLVRHYTSIGNNIKEPIRGLTPQQVKRVRDFVQAHLDQDLSLEDLAQQIGFSPYHFARLFRQSTGDSPHQFVLRQRVEQAQRLLTQKDLTLAQVAIESGFADQSHLTQVFKRYLGLTPRAYRQDRSI
jgi:AraC family transcriptional regulator